MVLTPHAREELLQILHTCEEPVPNPHTCVESQFVVCIYQLCEELESNAKCSSFRVYFIGVRNTYDFYIKFDYLCISLTREKYWDEIHDELVPTLHAL